jgi:hypothetical protein
MECIVKWKKKTTEKSDEKDGKERESVSAASDDV